MIINNIMLAIWAITIPLIPYTLLRKKHETFDALVMTFLFLSINVLVMLTTPNPDNVVLIAVTTR